MSRAVQCGWACTATVDGDSVSLTDGYDQAVIHDADAARALIQVLEQAIADGVLR